MAEKKEMDKKENKEVKKVETKKEDAKKVEAKKDGAKFEQVTPKKAKAEAKETKKKEKVKGKVTIEGNKKTKKSGLIITIVIVLVLLIVAASIFVMLNSKPKTVVNNLLNDLKQGNLQNASTYFNQDEENIQENFKIGGQELDEEALKLIFEKLEWKVNKEEINGDNAAVEVEVTNKDFQVILTNYTQKLIGAAFTGTTLGDEQYKSYLMDELRKEDIATKTTTATINLVKIDGKWKVVENDIFANLLLPGLQETIDAMNLLSE